VNTSTALAPGVIARLPADSRLITYARDYLVVSLPAGEARQHLAVIWDRGRDETILDVITAITYRDPHVRARIIGCAMERGVLTSWVSSDQADRLAIQGACDAALHPPKRWLVAPLQLVPIDVQRDRQILDRGNLIEGHPLLQIPRQYRLGVIGQVRS
jgi:hypothetical protein